MVESTIRYMSPLQEIPLKVREALSIHSALTQQLLFNRGIVSKEDADRFLNPDYEAHLHDPFLFTDMEKAVERILRAVKNEEHIVIYTDYDCDGIPGGVLLYDFLTAIGYSNFENYIPHRHHEGYGFNVGAVSKFVERDTKLIITVDCGITDHAGVEKANELGIDVIVTDHHEASDTLPPAYAVINPKRDDAYPFKGICGTGVAYKVVQAVLSRGRKSGQITLPEGFEKWWLDLVGIATIADMVPLIDENRVFAKYGLMVLRKSRRPGLQHLLRKAGGSQRHLTEDDIGFTIAPRINAASRMDDPEDAFHMLRTRNEVEAGTYVAHLEKLNNERKGIVASMVKEAKRRLEMMSEIPAVIVMGSAEWRPSLVGLVANTLSEEYKRPAFLWGRDGQDIIKGSCRSDGVVSVVSLMEGAKGHFRTCGGHHGSGGFSVDDERIHTLSDVLIQSHASLNRDTDLLNRDMSVDAIISPNEIDDSFLKTIELLGPFGEGNQKPLFRIEPVRVESVSVFGKTKNHTKLRIQTKGGWIDGITFFKLPTEFSTLPEAGKDVSLQAHIERSFFMGRLETRLRIVDILGI